MSTVDPTADPKADLCMEIHSSQSADYLHLNTTIESDLTASQKTSTKILLEGRSASSNLKTLAKIFPGRQVQVLRIVNSGNDCLHFETHLLQFVKNQSSTLQELHLTSCKVESARLATILNEASSLTSLGLQNTSSLDEKTFRALTNLPALSTLDLQGNFVQIWRSRTRRALRDAIIKHPTLQTVHFTEFPLPRLVVGKYHLFDLSLARTKEKIEKDGKTCVIHPVSLKGQITKGLLTIAVACSFLFCFLHRS